MKFGDLEIHPIFLGNMLICGGPTFGMIPKKIWNRYITCDNENRIVLALYSLLIKKDKQIVILDTGFGNKSDERTLKSFGCHNLVDIETALQDYNLYSGDITHCILTHLHVDHCSGCTKLYKDEIVPTFPNAKYYIQEKEFEDAMSPTFRTRSTYFPDNYEPIYKAGQLELIDGLMHINDFITVYPTKGHVNAMNIIQIRTGDVNIYYPGDLLSFKQQVHPLWNTAYDYYPLESESEKIKLLDKCAGENALLFMCHESEGSFYKVVKHGEYKYELLKAH